MKPLETVLTSQLILLCSTGCQYDYSIVGQIVYDTGKERLLSFNTIRKNPMTQAIQKAHKRLERQDQLLNTAYGQIPFVNRERLLEQILFGLLINQDL